MKFSPKCLFFSSYAERGDFNVNKKDVHRKESKSEYPLIPDEQRA